MLYVHEFENEGKVQVIILDSFDLLSIVREHPPEVDTKHNQLVGDFVRECTHLRTCDLSV